MTTSFPDWTPGSPLWKNHAQVHQQVETSIHQLELWQENVQSQPPPIEVPDGGLIGQLLVAGYNGPQWSPIGEDDQLLTIGQNGQLQWESTGTAIGNGNYNEGDMLVIGEGGPEWKLKAQAIAKDAPTTIGHVLTIGSTGEPEWKVAQGPPGPQGDPGIDDPPAAGYLLVSGTVNGNAAPMWAPQSWLPKELPPGGLQGQVPMIEAGQVKWKPVVKKIGARRTMPITTWPASTYQVMQFSTVIPDNTEGVASGVSAFLLPVDGLYAITCHITTSQASVAPWSYVGFHINHPGETARHYTFHWLPSGNGVASATLPVAAGDTVTFNAYNISTSPLPGVTAVAEVWLVTPWGS
jgi:hypothetical protein